MFTFTCGPGEAKPGSEWPEELPNPEPRINPNQRRGRTFLHCLYLIIELLYEKLFVPESVFRQDEVLSAWEMDQRNLQQDFQDQLNDVVGRFQSKNFFQSDLDIAFFAVFFIFIGMILLLLILVLIRCCCCCCCQDDLKPRRQKRGVVNMALEP
ncbi:Small integral membrane protein 22 [Oryzias melastigma]|uniref:Small integral membrane protein 22 n=2 Tax=Oryzias melastigma TaxID=30732 RepID=A0A834FFC6_ORYME|nr:Small integral membrane protein 22 [Oryzias melastigma]